MAELPTPAPENRYRVYPDHKLTAALLNLILTSVAERLEAREALEATFQGLITTGTDQALEVIQENVAPQLAAVNAALANVQTALVAAEDAVAELLSNNIPATNVTVTPGGSISATTAQGAIIELAGDVQAAETRIGTAEDRLDGLDDSVAAMLAAIPSRGKIVGLSYGDGIGF